SRSERNSEGAYRRLDDLFELPPPIRTERRGVEDVLVHAIWQRRFDLVTDREHMHLLAADEDFGAVLEFAGDESLDQRRFVRVIGLRQRDRRLDVSGLANDDDAAAAAADPVCGLEDAGNADVLDRLATCLARDGNPKLRAWDALLGPLFS